MGPDGARNKKWLCWQGPAEINLTGLDFIFSLMRFLMSAVGRQISEHQSTTLIMFMKSVSDRIWSYHLIYSLMLVQYS
jgi:hypothetical protein